MNAVRRWRAQLYANEQWHNRSDSQSQAGLDSHGRKMEKEEEKLTVAVSNLPKLCALRLFVYKDKVNA